MRIARLLLGGVASLWFVAPWVGHELIALEVRGADMAVDAVASPPSFPSSVDPAGRFVLDQGGDRWLMFGDAAWAALGQLAVPEMDTYLDGIAGYGFNTTLVSLIEVAYSSSPPRNANGDAPFSGTMFQSAPVEAYWSHVDTFVAKAAARGITVLAVPAYLGYAGDGVTASVDAASNAQMRAYGEFLGARYADDPNIMWMAGGDQTAVSPTTLARVDSMMIGIAGTDAHHLRTGHVADGATADDVWGGYGWLNVNVSYEVQGAPVDPGTSGSAADAYDDAPARPTFHSEGKYEGDLFRSPPAGYGSAILRYQSWGPMLAGSFGFVFGTNDRWHFDYGGAYDTGDATWQSTLSDPSGNDDLGTIHQGILAGFVRSFGSDAWGTLGPDTTDTFLTAGEGTGASRAAAAFSASLGVVYLPTPRTGITIDTTELSGTGNVRLRWFDPTNGTYTTIAASEPQAPSRAIAYPPPNAAGDNDWVLVIEQAEAVPTSTTTTQSPTTTTSTWWCSRASRMTWWWSWWCSTS